MGRMFGRDGMRGIAVTELTCELALQIGRAAAVVLAAHNTEKTKILIGMDTRSSSDSIAAALCAGICSAGADAELIGEVPTPALAWLTKESGANGGIMVTASHINAEFSGIKLFSASGHRLSDDREEEIERLILDAPSEIVPIPRRNYGKLSNNSIIFTQANNLGLLQFARTNGIGTSASSAGERSMIRRMLECGYSLAGDPAGHILFPDLAPSADGQLTGIMLLDVLKRSGKKLSELAAVIEKCPQVMLNVPIDKRCREVWKNDRAVTGIIDEFEQILGEEGRVVVREVGAEPVIRIMIEGRDFTTINTMALQIADTIKERLTLQH